MLSKPDNRFLLINIAEGRRGTRQTLNLMGAIVKQWRVVPDVRNLSSNIVSQLPGKSFTAEVQRIFDWVRGHIRYLQDVNDVETLQTPDVTIANASGDCDDMSVLLATMLESIGHKCRFKAIGTQPGIIEHVYVQTLIGPNIPDNWIALDATEDYPMGWEPTDNIEEWMYGNF